jgi:hypothetical protein
VPEDLLFPKGKSTLLPTLPQLTLFPAIGRKPTHLTSPWAMGPWWGPGFSVGSRRERTVCSVASIQLTEHTVMGAQLCHRWEN